MAVVARKRARNTVYFVVTSCRGTKTWERVGTDKREAQRLDERRKKEVKAGTFIPHVSTSAKVGTFLRQWLSERKVRSAVAERTFLDLYVFDRDWFCSMPVRDVRPKDAARLIAELKVAPLVSDPSRCLAPKSVANIYGILRTAFRDAEIQEATSRNPFQLPRGTLSRRPQTPRQAYSAPDALLLVVQAGHWARLVWNALALYTGMREGEVCGRRWRDWLRDSSPLSGLDVRSQYDDQPLKTDAPRVVPVHPELDRILTWWHSDGFELVYLRPPTPDDWIVPRLDVPVSPHTKSSAYKAWRRSCVAAGVTNRTLHSTRHTFITLARRNGARSEVLEVVTHNGKGKMIDAYTHWDWDPLCEAVTCFPRLLVDAPVDSLPFGTRIAAPALGLELGVAEGNQGNEGESDPDSVLLTLQIPPRIRQVGAGVCAGQPEHSEAALMLRDVMEELLAAQARRVSS